MKNTLVIITVLSLFMVTVAFAGQPGLIEENKDQYPIKDIESVKKKIKGEDEDIKVIITLKDIATDDNILQLQNRAGNFKVGKKGWNAVYPNGFAATIKRSQLENIRRDPYVTRVDIDRQARIHLETANYWSGATKVRSPSPVGYGATGDVVGGRYNYGPGDIVIAVVDTGIDPKHKDLTGLNNGGTAKIIGWYDAYASKSSPYDDHGHGTHVASIAAGEGDDDARYKGVAPGAALVGVKVCSPAGLCTDSDIIEGINWVVSKKAIYGIEILTMSIGGVGSSDGTDPTSTAVDNVVNAGIVVTLSAGNDGAQKYTISSPAAAKKAITVGAIADPGYKLIHSLSSPTGVMPLADNGFYIAPFSSRGPTADNRLKPDIIAPGVAITAAKAIYPNAGTYHGGYVVYSGTSMAAPFTAGAIALMLDVNSSLTPTQIKDIIRNTAEDYGVSGCDIDYGCGRIRTYRAVKMAKTGINTYIGDQSVPTHIRSWGFMDDNTGKKNYQTSITNDTYPLASVLIMSDWSGSDPGIDLDLAVYGPSGELIGSRIGIARQETLVISPDALGKYNVSVVKWLGSGKYTLDRSFK